MDDDIASVSSHDENAEKSQSAPNNNGAFGLFDQAWRLVIGSKGVMIVILLASLLIIAIFTNRIIEDQENGAFVHKFRYDARDFSQIVVDHVENLQSRLGLLSIFMTTTAVSKGEVFPNVTLPGFEILANRIISETTALAVAYMPLVSETVRTEWEAYSEQNAEKWLREGSVITPFIFTTDAISGDKIPDTSVGPYAPLWTVSPLPSDPSDVNYNLFNQPAFDRVAQSVVQSKAAGISEVLESEEIFRSTSLPRGRDPQSLVMYPVFTDSRNISVAGFLTAVFSWDSLFVDTIQDDNSNMHVIVEGKCGTNFTYRVEGGGEAMFEGYGDLHENKYNNVFEQSELVPSSPNATMESFNSCDYRLVIFPTSRMEGNSTSNAPVVYTVAVIAIFFFTTFVFFLYDVVVMRRQRLVIDSAMRATSIVMSLFPKSVADQLAQDRVEEEKKAREHRRQKRNAEKEKKEKNNHHAFDLDGSEGENLIQQEEEEDEILIDTKPIADLFPSATVLFADIAGFTAWSSIREPSQVFILLENIYRVFDKIAVQRGIFKVETIGDCYVAVCGLPEPNKEHAIAMCKFARDCMERMNGLVHKLEAKLGPDTGDLSMRFGLHSGPVTAGVLRGDRARFQLFGDTVNTASRMESTGLRDKIHLSQECAEQLINHGKAHWIVPREDTVVAKGKGELRTFWLLPKDDAGPASKPAESAPVQQMENLAPGMGQALVETIPVQVKNDKIQRMIDWNCDILLQLMRLIIAKRQASRRQSQLGTEQTENPIDLLERKIGSATSPMDEIVEVIELPKFDAAAYEKDPRFVEITEEVETQLHSFVTMIASMYRDYPFHNFEHASHVSMSTVKLLSRIVAPGQQMKEGTDGLASEDLHDHTYGITSDPLTQFAVVLSALIHDVDHRGVPNFILATEDQRLASVYQNQSIAEQNSIDVAWEVLMDDQFKDLRRTIYTSDEELNRFRQLLVNTVMATDIFDKELAALRKNRWDRAFGEMEGSTDTQSSINRKATVVMEHLIQASDVSHTMQHWHVYTKWNERLYREMYSAYLAGRWPKDPSEGWYEGEIKFFDGWVIPLAKKLKECGVFGVSSDEYLNYAEKNRAEWVVRGEEMVQAFKTKAVAKIGKFKQQQAKLAPQKAPEQAAEASRLT